ncbi:zinc finger MYM-type protein 1 [Capsicum annuum]|uniref:zinc finger MYM-type protein 1 n=1 Tax=Capsicum annuum TaxID=4072 RepID=UPI001FB114F6|nr:zinc finger MYM-type protein 1 [Capsicum annuum]
MAVVLPYVDDREFVLERFLDIVHVKNTSVLSLKDAIVNLLSQNSLSLSYVHGQSYDGASNMQGDINGFKMLINNESKLAYSIHCFAHQLQLTLIGVSKRCLQVELVHLVSDIFNMLGSSYKCMDEYTESQKTKIQEAFDTRWASHFKYFNYFIHKFDKIIDKLDNIVETAHSLNERSRAKGYIRAAQTCEIEFILHLMKEILGITNDLSTCLQNKEQDIANVMLRIDVAKRRLQELREDNKWDFFVSEVSTFCIKHNIVVPTFDELYVNSERSWRKSVDYTVFHHYRVEVFCKIIDWQLQELNDHFDELTTEFLHGVSCLSPVDSFSSFDIQKIMRMTELYPDDFDELNMCALKNQLANNIIDVCDIDKRFSNINRLCDLSKRLI